MTHLSLFSGIGGLDLAAEWAGFETVGQCEWADYPTKVLEKHWPDVPRWRDIRTMTGDSFYEQTGLRTVDVISGGFPCQPFSVAGKQKGKEDNRYLWPEMLRVIRELAPRWVIGENVPGILNIAADDVCADLEREGYEVGIFDFEAAAVGAPHRRERIAFVASAMENPSNRGREQSGILQEQPRGAELVRASQSGTNGKPAALHENVADTDQARIQGRSIAGSAESIREKSEQHARGCREGYGQWAVEPDVGRVANGVPCRVDRLKCLGNAVVPQQFYPIFKAIADYEMELICYSTMMQRNL